MLGEGSRLSDAASYVPQEDCRVRGLSGLSSSRTKAGRSLPFSLSFFFFSAAGPRPRDQASLQSPACASSAFILFFIVSRPFRPAALSQMQPYVINAQLRSEILNVFFFPQAH
jgi:hypothetical protein